MNHKVNKSFKVRAYPSKNQEEMIFKSFGATRYIFNELLNLNNFQYNSGCGIAPPKNYETLIKDIKPFLKEVDSTILQQSRKDLIQSFKNFFRRVKKGEDPGYPKFKSKHNNRQSFRTTNKKVDLVKKTAYFPKIGDIKFKSSFRFPKDLHILSKTLVFENNRFFVVFTCKDVPVEILPKTGKSVGIDLGLKDALNLSDGVKSSKIFDFRNDNRIKRLNKKLAKQVKDSNNWLKTKTKLNNCYYHKKESIKDKLHKITTNLVRDFDTIVVGNVNSKLGLSNHNLAKTTADQHWFEIKRQLEYKSNWFGKDFKLVDERYTSKTCSECGFVLDSLDLGVRHWICPNCGSNHDRDTNAAKNILTVGLMGIKNITKHVFGNACGKTKHKLVEQESPHFSEGSSQKIFIVN
ncbi:MAG: IS200/IS605 family element transposase accessory protein TnpB [Methanobrevibacter sp. CfCl-M3]